MLDHLLDEIHAEMTDPVLPFEGEELLSQIISDKLEDLRREDTIKLSRLWSLMQELMERDDVKLSDRSINLGHEDAGAEEAFIILLTDLLVAAYEAEYQPVG